MLTVQGIQSVVLHMNWGRITDPASLPDFEMLARKARYRLIAETAIQRNIRHLFLGHHQDDQVETILMRLIRNTNTSFLGLQAMSEVSSIPCCEDIRGAHEIEQYEMFPDWLHRFDITIPAGIEGKSSTNRGKPVTVSRPGGLQIHRPLLLFPKSRLIETCKDNGIIFQKDETNDDPTLTLRNAVRLLRKDRNGSKHEQHLPRALRAQSILHLCDWARNAASSLVERGTDILRKIKVEVFDLRSGLMTVRLSRDFIPACEADPQAGSNALSRLTSVVSYQSRDDVPTIVPWDRLREFLGASSSPGPSVLTIQKVLLERLEAEGSSVQDGHVRWRLSRPPMRPSEATSAQQVLRSKSATPDITQTPGCTWQADADATEGVWSDWILWDHRYWIRVRAQSVSSFPYLSIQPYQASNAPYVFKALKKESTQLRKALSEAAPGKLRYTLPVLVYRGRPSVFPTLNVVVPAESSKEGALAGSRPPILEWEVAYKVMDQPFINEQAKTIEWRNAQVKRRRATLE